MLNYIFPGFGLNQCIGRGEIPVLTTLGSLFKNNIDPAQIKLA